MTGRAGRPGMRTRRRPGSPITRTSAGLAASRRRPPGEVVAMNTLTVNLHLMLASFYRPAGERAPHPDRGRRLPLGPLCAWPRRSRWHGLDPAEALIELAPAAGEDLHARPSDRTLASSITAREIALVLWPGVQYLTGQVFDLARIARAAHRAGCVVGFDLAHSIGNVPLALHDSGADFAVWCSYKYLNAGPGAIGGCFVHERHAHDAAPAAPRRLVGPRPGDALRDGAASFVAAAGAEGWQISNPPILSAAPLLASLGLFDAGRHARGCAPSRWRSPASSPSCSIRLAGWIDHDAARAGRARLPAVAAHAGGAPPRPARVRTAWRRAAWSATGASRT